MGHLTKLSMCMSKALVCGRKCEVVIGGTSNETFDVHVKCPLFALVVSVMLSMGVGRQALHSPSPSTISSSAMRTPEEEGLHFRPSSSHCGCALATLHRALRGVSVRIHQGTCRNRQVVLRQERHAHTVLMSKFKNVRLQSKGYCRLHYWLCCGPRTPRMSLPRLFKSKQSAGQFDRHISFPRTVVVISVSTWCSSPGMR